MAQICGLYFSTCTATAFWWREGCSSNRFLLPAPVCCLIAVHLAQGPCWSGGCTAARALKDTVTRGRITLPRWNAKCAILLRGANKNNLNTKWPVQMLVETPIRKTPVVKVPRHDIHFRWESTSGSLTCTVILGRLFPSALSQEKWKLSL